MPQPPSARACLAAMIIAAILGALAWPLVGTSFASRSLDLTFAYTGNGPVSLRWHHARGFNGTWLDLNDPKFPKPPDKTGRRTCHLVQDLPSYRVDRLELKGEDAGTLSVTEARLRRRLVGVALPSTLLSPDATGTSVALAQFPSIQRQTWFPGILVTASLAAAAVGAIALLARLIAAYDRRLARTRLPATPASPRRTTIAVLATAIAVPALFALWAPMFLLADSTAYVWFAHLLHETRSVMHFDGWRLPGYGLLVAAAMPLATDYAVLVGIAQTLMGIATPLLVYDMLRSRVPSRWAAATAILVALDPVLLGWQRVLMPETLSGLLITLAAWLFLRLSDRASGRSPTAATPTRTLLHALLLGLTCGAACIVRGNNQVLPAILIAALVWLGYTRKHWPLIAAAVTTALATFAVMLPLFIINHRNHNLFTFAVGRDFTRSLFSWTNGTTDWNQCGTFSFDEFRTLRDKLRTRAMTDWDVMGVVGKTRTVPVPEGANTWLAQEVRCRVLVNEALARQGPDVALKQLQAATIILGIPITEPYYGVRGTWAIFTQLRGRDNHRTVTNFDFKLGVFPDDVQATLQRSIHDVAWLYRNPIARVYGAWFNLWRWLRALLAITFLFALGRLIYHRQWALAALGAVVLANAVGVPVLTYAAEYRYAAPYYALMFAVAAWGLRWTPSGVAKATPE